MTNEKVKMVCKHCGSEEIFRDACAMWNIESQQWELVTLYDNTDCEQCQGETSLEMIKL